jgi:glycosyltransferase involved in cell wall biosynthesis
MPAGATGAGAWLVEQDGRMNSAPDRRPLVCVLGIDTLRPKNLYQTRFLAEQGIAVDVLTMHRDAGSLQQDFSARVVGLPASAVARTRAVVAYLRANRRRLHHAELYVGGRFSVVHALLCRLLGVPLLVVERGDLLLCRKRVHPLLTRLSIYGCYALASAIWCKEPYMVRALSRWRPRGAFELPNAVPVPAMQPPGPRDIDLLWVNRLVPERHPVRYARCLEKLRHEVLLSAAVLGFGATADDLRTQEQEAAVRDLLVDAEEVTLLGFTDPAPWLARGRYFVLPADIAFGNFAVLEAMAHGVVPVVSGTEGVDRLVDDGVEGIVAEHDEPGLERALRAALAMPEDRWLQMSAAARRRVEQEYSVPVWGRRLLQEYRRLDRRNGPALPGQRAPSRR